MDKDFMQYVYARIETALEEDTEYTELQSKYDEAQHNKDNELADDLLFQLEAKSEELCYMQGYKDGMRIALKLMGGQPNNEK